MNLYTTSINHSHFMQNEQAREVQIANGTIAGVFTHQLVQAILQSSGQPVTYAGHLDLLPQPCNLP
jgi:hypothetical protein